MKLIMNFSITILIAMVLLLPGCGKTRNTNIVQEEKIIPVNVTDVVSGSIENKIRFLGDIKAYQEVNVYATVPEQITSLKVDINDVVEKGDLLATVKDVAIRQGVLQAEAGLSSTKSQYENVNTEWGRIQKLYKESAVSKSQYDAVKTQKESAESAVKQLTAGLKSAKEQLKNTNIKAPISGIISARNFNLGDLTSPQLPAFTIVNMQKVKIYIDIVENQISQMREGQKAIIQVTSYPGEVFIGRVDKVYPTLNPMTRSARAEIVIDNADFRLKPGMYATVDIITKQKNNVLLIPSYSIIEKTNLEYLGGEVSNTKISVDKYVYTVKDSIAIRQPLVTGIEDMGIVEVISGLHLNDVIVTLGQYDLTDSAKVRIIRKGIES